MSGSDSLFSRPEEAAAAKVAEMESRLAELRARLPRHSVPPGMLLQLEELEAELEQARRLLASRSGG